MERLEASNLLLRGCVLKNTDWVLGLVISAGNDTKIFRNRAAAPRKVLCSGNALLMASNSVTLASSLCHSCAQLDRPCSPMQVTKLEGNMNILVIAVFISLLAIAALCSFANDQFLQLNSATAWYMWTDG